MALKKKILLIFCLVIALPLGFMLWFYFYTGDIFVIDSFSGKSVCIDGCYVFDLFTKLVDSDGSPLANTEVIAFIDQGEANPSDNHPDSPSFAKTDSEGNVQLTAFTGLAWGGIYRPGLELPPRPSGPHTPKVLCFWHKDANDQWHQIQINIEEKYIKRAKHDTPQIHIDKIQVKVSGRSYLNHSPLGRYVVAPPVRVGIRISQFSEPQRGDIISVCRMPPAARARNKGGANP